MLKNNTDIRFLSIYEQGFKQNNLFIVNFINTNDKIRANFALQIHFMQHSSILLRLSGVLSLLAFAAVLPAQDSIPYTTQDSLRFATAVSQWTQLPEQARDSMPDWQIRTIISVAAAPVADSVRLRRLTFYNATRLHESEKEQYQTAKADTLVTKDDLAAMKNRVSAAAAAKKAAEKSYREALKVYEKTEKALVKNPATQRKQLPGIFTACRNFVAPPPPEAPVPDTETVEKKPKRNKREPENAGDTAQQSPEPEAPSNDSDGKKIKWPKRPKKEESDMVTVDSTATSVDTTTAEIRTNRLKLGKNKPKTPESPTFTRYSAEKDVMLNPPAPPCNIAVTRKDAFTGALYRETAKTELFRFTNAVMKKVLPPDQPHITCTAALAGDATAPLLLLTFTVKDANARRMFGGLPHKSLLQLKFMDGDLTALYNESRAEGQFDPETGIAIFTAQYPFQPSVLKKMEKTELDQIRVAWSTGYEDYSVQYVHLLMQQAACLRNP